MQNAINYDCIFMAVLGKENLLAFRQMPHKILWNSFAFLWAIDLLVAMYFLY